MFTCISMCIVSTHAYLGFVFTYVFFMHWLTSCLYYIGESIPVSEQASLKSLRADTQTVSESTSSDLTADERRHLYAQLDEKVSQRTLLKWRNRAELISSPILCRCYACSITYKRVWPRQTYP